jgi:hypothetical protein
VLAAGTTTNSARDVSTITPLSVPKDSKLKYLPYRLFALEFESPILNDTYFCHNPLYLPELHNKNNCTMDFINSQNEVEEPILSELGYANLLIFFYSRRGVT